MAEYFLKILILEFVLSLSFQANFVLTKLIFPLLRFYLFLKLLRF